MRLDVVFAPVSLAGTEVQGRSVFVVDILRATTVVCAALCHGARAVIPTGSTEEALRLAQTLASDNVLLTGERNEVRIPGFHLGNSPREMTPEAVRGRTLIMTTTNGTRALLATQGAEAVYLAAAANHTLAGQRAREIWERERDLLILCSGRQEQFALDDAYEAGRLVLAALGGQRRSAGLNDAAVASLDLVRRYGERWERPLRLSEAGQSLLACGLGEDVTDAARPDAYPVLPRFADRRITAVATPV